MTLQLVQFPIYDYRDTSIALPRIQLLVNLMNEVRVFAFFFIGVLLTTGPCTYCAEFIPLGDIDIPEGVVSSVASAISSNGSVVAGTGSRFASSTNISDAFLWAETNGIASLQTSLLIDSPRTEAIGISGDGGVIVGAIGEHTLSTIKVSSEPFRWTASEGIVPLGFLSNVTPGSHGAAGDVSDDGSVIVGGSSNNDGFVEAFRWTSQSGMTGIGDLSGGDFFSVATGIAAAGDVIVGTSRSELGSEAFVWTETNGMVGLGDLPGGYSGSSAEAVSGDGTTVIGNSWSALSEGTREAFRWTQSSGMQPLGDLPGGYYYSSAQATNFNGSIIVGFGYTVDGARAFVWDEVHGMRELQEVLLDEFGLGAQIAGWTLTVTTDISDDGLSIVGHGINPNGNTEAWLVRLDHPLNIPEPNSASMFALFIAAIFGNRRQAGARCAVGWGVRKKKAPGSATGGLVNLSICERPVVMPRAEVRDRLSASSAAFGRCGHRPWPARR